ncbi:hypothetical protein PLESTB_001049600 [Pleodorina starrii]|uniref:Essential protein Yae1 N-terminal domain-containing protein n=1 Tax=Pleodorina starrii TaxID=330485 RepID=A0A9W6F497_9CHLO|nr:hypothetical protein PLESTM_001267600 [Pleodorina starrii]GLC55963.1 hypothetical protein PLESTB_001049600 [Pleodorina starrii]GLC63948.1 hypothetical protein PLESTF_000101900 [Pleodorina starrii]
MCTAQPNARSDSGDDDDVWADSSDDGNHDADQRELGREAAARHQHFYNAGYRDGLDEGKEMRLQEGFNTGFMEGAAAGFEWGLLRGAVKTLAALDGQAAGTRGLHGQIQALQAAADVPPREAMLAIFRHVLSSPPQQPQPPPPQQNQPQPQPPPDAQSSTPPPAPQDLPRPSPTSAAPGRSMDSSSSVGGSSDPRVGPCGDNDSGTLPDLVDAFSGMAVAPAEAAASAASAPGQTAEPPPPAAPASLPPDARGLDLPDMVRVMQGLRTGLAGLGFELGAAPPQRQGSSS